MKMRIENANYILDPLAKYETEMGIENAPGLSVGHRNMEEFSSLRDRSTNKVCEQATKKPKSTIKFADALDKSVFNEAERLHALGFEQRKAGDFVKAIDFYTESLAVLPNNFKVLFNRGFAYDKLGEYQLAIQDYTKAVDLEPTNPFAFYNRGISLDKKGLYDEAISNFTTAISLQSDKADFYHNRGFAYRKKKDYPHALEDYSKAIALAPNHFKVQPLFQPIGILQSCTHSRKIG